ncbi:hypothetical protein KUL25_16420 [Rhodobacteraceae bacterium N5(2021)]|uniref:Sulfotransferase n=1 Tax=Gymnodinialimonas phycosphaerae TaxID=2841589 RepID=A0A975TT41_9RHOB|nr:hypothetical protein [Gymnodinialimonas phycosphaerae]MBY4894343.1 hypothetical protein [Gymnodinialimonas phycosphaerae]
MPNIVHIGLGKTATTTLQLIVFPLLCKLKGFEYNNPVLKNLSLKRTLIDLSDAEQQAQRELLARGNNFISNEALAGWDPAIWEVAAEENLRTFGRDTIILITFRESYSFIRSVYQQYVQGGNVVRPEYFFVDKKTYHDCKRLRSEFKLDYYCTDYLNYDDLVGFYTSRFARVVCVDMKNIGKFDFLDGIIDLDDAEKRKLAVALERAPRKNRSYSSGAMKLTFWREKFSNALGLKTFGSSDLRYEKLLTGFGDWSDAPLPLQYKNLSRRDQILQFPKRAFKRITRWLGVSSWNLFMHQRLDRFVPYKEYELPIDRLSINRENMDKCNAFLDRLNAGTAAGGAPETKPAPLRQN